MGAIKERAHILLVTFPAQGHVKPAIRLARRLASDNRLRVSFATNEAIGKQLHDAGTTTTSGTDAHVEFLTFFDGLAVDEDRRDLDWFMAHLNRAGPNGLAALISDLEARGRRVHCVVSNPFVPWVVDVAEGFSIPCALLWVQSCAIYALYYRSVYRLSEFPTPEKPDIDISLPGLPVLQASELPSFLLPSAAHRCLADVILSHIKKIKKVKWVLGNSFYALETEAIQLMEELAPIRPIGPLVPSELLGQSTDTEVRGDLWKPAHDCLDWLSTQPQGSVIYVAFGSVVTLSTKQIEELAWGLSSSGRPFLWAAKPVDSTSEFQLPDGFLKVIVGRGKLVKWCPQVEVLTHPSVACFVTHCGWNSTLETIAAGTPVIALPHWGDQVTNAKFLVDIYGVGVRLKRGSEGFVRREEVCRCMDEIMEGPSALRIRDNAIKLKEAARDAWETGGSSDKNLKAFVEEVISLGRQEEVIEARLPSLNLKDHALTE
ncbi:limonoid UDP-glucosyltransferase [Amborella trichopoda]|uniref:Glycosyltransferase n=1 Tax=Amborella trichopoda TaxID=13333 RepID=W1PLB6_AMBTC|nr:limonoid UDP-glucosyltransferase [Amborella trichopoda]ERN08828.1 hypothetical protein AMTR_s00015p00021860 [Amborella trichopoda]|eukprot:XP_006847247.1 limonoid UDP-glucosyltransferase [Amborella trichopoda]